ncbi:MAG: ribose-phosphate diphosphokinase [Myxococcota bacterium]
MTDTVLRDPRSPLCLLACRDGAVLAQGVADRLGTRVIPGEELWFASGEAKYSVRENVRGCDCYVFQQPIVPGASGVHDAQTTYDRLVAVLHAADALRHADAARVTVVMPYLPGCRQDKRKDHAREGVSTGLFARMFAAAGVSMVITVDPHNESLVGAYDPVRCVLEAVSVAGPFSDFLAQTGLVADVVASTDVGGLELARRYAHRLGKPIAALSKERDYSRPHTIAATTVIGEVSGRSVLIVDDIVDTAGSMESAVRALWEQGATDVVVAGVHLLLSGDGWARLHRLHADAIAAGRTFRVASTASVVHPTAPDWMVSMPLEPLLADVIRSVNTRGSVRALEHP